jgi:hypothetical protein
MATLVDIFLQPGKAFADLRERPTFVVPFLLLAGLSVALTLAYFLRVDPSWYADHMFAAANADVSAKDLEKLKAAMPGTHAMAGIGAISGIIGIAAIAAITALYLWIAGKVTGKALGYKQGLSLNLWSAMPGVLGLLVALAGALTMAPQTGIESLMLTHLDPLLVQLPAGSRWNRLAEGFDLLSLWSIFLLALGWRTFTRSSWLQAVVVALIPSVVVFGVIALVSH